MNITGTFDILHQRPQSSVWIRTSWCWALHIPQSWQSQACCLRSDCQLKNLLVIGPQNIGRLPVVTALTVNVHLISLEFAHTEAVCCYLQPEPESESVPLYTRPSCSEGRDDRYHYVNHYWNTLVTVTMRAETKTNINSTSKHTHRVVIRPFCSSTTHFHTAVQIKQKLNACTCLQYLTEEIINPGISVSSPDLHSTATLRLTFFS